MDLVAYIVSAMLFWSPLHESMAYDEPMERFNRYYSIASDIVEVATDPNEKPAFKEPFAREKTALLLASVARHESNFDEDIDTGKKRGDNGRSVCIMQVMTNTGLKRYKTDYLLEDRKNCIRAALSIMRSKCAGGIFNRLRAYASGTCKKREDPTKEAKVQKATKGLVMPYVLWYNKYPIENYLNFTQ